ncbi:MAG: hypothetical protein ABFD91_14865 [Anaerohalosphaeraceae bacterium]
MLPLQGDWDEGDGTQSVALGWVRLAFQAGMGRIKIKVITRDYPIKEGERRGNRGSNVRKWGEADIVGMGNRILTQKKQSSIQKSL